MGGIVVEPLSKGAQAEPLRLPLADETRRLGLVARWLDAEFQRATAEWAVPSGGRRHLQWYGGSEVGVEQFAFTKYVAESQVRIQVRVRLGDTLLQIYQAIGPLKQLEIQSKVVGLMQGSCAEILWAETPFVGLHLTRHVYLEDVTRQGLMDAVRALHNQCVAARSLLGDNLMLVPEGHKS